MVVTKYLARLGNQMFNYALGRIIAEEKGHAMEIDPPQEYRHDIPVFFPKTNEIIKGKRVLDNCLLFGEPQRVDIKKAISHEGMVKLDTYGQRYEYYKDRIKDIREWFAMDESDCTLPDDNSLVIHLRLEDFATTNYILPTEYIFEQATKVVKEHNLKKGYVVTHDINNPVVAYFKDRGFKLFNKSIKEDLVFMRNAKHLIISQSTFSWWAGVLGNGQVYIPAIEIHPNHWVRNSKPEQIDLNLTGERFNYF